MLVGLEVLLLSGLVSYCWLKWLKYYRVPETFPPGPPAVPLLGVLPFVKGDFKAAMQAWREEYGEVVGLQLGQDLAVVLSDFDIISDAFKDSRVTGRPRSLQQAMSAFFASGEREKNGGIVFTHGQQWTEQRRFALKTLRDFGFGKKCMERVIHDEIDKLVKEVMKNDRNSNSATLCQLLSVSVVNSIWTILTGEKIPHGDATVSEIVKGTDEFIKNESLSGPIMMLPWLRHFPGVKEKFLSSKQAPLKMRQLQDATVSKHLGNINSDTSSGDFIDVYLSKIASTTDITSSFYGEDGRLNLQRSLTDLFGAGSETSSSMLLFAFLYMIKYPEVQRNIQAEISSVVPLTGRVTLESRPLMPYTDAVLHEVMRHVCLVYAVPHATTQKMNLGSYELPEDTAVYANVWRVMHSPEYWPDPEVFNPSRFLRADGSFRRDERCIPFMLGKRFCIGQTLAQDQLFLFFAGILHRFELEAPEGPDRVSTDPVVGFIHSCPTYSVSIRPRSQTTTAAA